MERVMSVEDKIKRAEEIYARRQGENVKRSAKVNVSNDNKKDIRLLKKMIIQIIVCLLIYFGIYIIQNSNYIFSENCIKKVNEVLSYDTNFMKIYENLKNNISGLQGIINKEEKENSEQNTTQEEQATEENSNQSEENIVENKEEQNDNNNELSQEDKDIKRIKEISDFIKPVDGIITSKYGQREPTTSNVPKNHTGVDIAANTGTKIKSATSGEVVLVSEEGDYGKHIKVQKEEMSIIYAHCNSIYVKQGDLVEQGQEIAEVGSTGNSTGSHLHFEIRISEITIDPEKILQL